MRKREETKEEERKKLERKENRQRKQIWDIGSAIILPCLEVHVKVFESVQGSSFKGDKVCKI